jgi:hypothetical protein
MKRRVVIMEAYREFLVVRRNGENFNETSLGASYGFHFK